MQHCFIKILQSDNIHTRHQSPLLFPYTTLFRSNDIALAVCGPEGPLADGIAEHFARRRVPFFGPTQGAANIEASKSYAKKDRKSTRLNSSHLVTSYAVFCLKKKKIKMVQRWISF